SAWLRALQEENLALREHECAPLYEIQRWAGRAGQALFDSIIVFENYPVDEALRSEQGELRFGAVRGLETTNYPLTLTVTDGRELHVVSSYLQSSFTAAQITQVHGHLLQLLQELTLDADRMIGELRFQGDAESGKVLSEWVHGERQVTTACAVQ